MKRSDEARRLDKLYDRLHSKDERIKELEEKLKEEYNRGIKDGLNQAADIIKYY